MAISFTTLTLPKYELFYSDLNIEERLKIHEKDDKITSKENIFRDYVLSLIVKEKGVNISLLDIGCATGDFLDRAHASGIQRLTGIEPTPSLVAFNKKHGRHNVIEGYYSQKQFKAESFDVIYHSRVLEHVTNPVEFCKSNYYHLVPGGMLVVSVPSIRSLTYWLQVITNPNFCDIGPINPQHRIYFDPNTLKSTLKLAGFSNISIKTGLWRYKRPTHGLLWQFTTDPIFNLFKIGDILAFARK